MLTSYLSLHESTPKGSILAIPASELTAVFTPDETGRYPRLEGNLSPQLFKMYHKKMSKLGLASGERTAFMDGLDKVPLEHFFKMGNESLFLKAEPDAEAIFKKINEFVSTSSSDNFTYAVIREKSSGQVHLSRATNSKLLSAPKRRANFRSF